MSPDEDDEDVALPVTVPVPVVDLLVNVEDVGTVVPTADRLRIVFFLAEELVDIIILSICEARLSDESFRRSSGLDAAAALSPVTPGVLDVGDTGPGDSDSDGEEAIGG